jgi:hypothetical protein
MNAVIQMSCERRAPCSVPQHRAMSGLPAWQKLYFKPLCVFGTVPTVFVMFLNVLSPLLGVIAVSRGCTQRNGDCLCESFTVSQGHMHDQDPQKVPTYIVIHISAISSHFLLAAAAVHCTCSGDPSREGFAFNNFFCRARPMLLR